MSLEPKWDNFNAFHRKTFSPENDQTRIYVHFFTFISQGFQHLLVFNNTYKNPVFSHLHWFPPQGKMRLRAMWVEKKIPRAITNE